jgi:hypothetical protein
MLQMCFSRDSISLKFYKKLTDYTFRCQYRPPFIANRQAFFKRGMLLCSPWPRFHRRWTPTCPEPPGYDPETEIIAFQQAGSV